MPENSNGKDIFGFFQNQENKVFQDNGNAFMIGPSEGGSEPAMTLVQNWAIDYQMQLTPIYECGTSNVYWSIKHGAGQFQCSRILADDYRNIPGILGDPCGPKDPVITAGGGMCSKEGGKSGVSVKVTLKSSILSGIRFSGQAQNAYIGMDCTAQFVNLQVDPSN